MGNTCKPLAVSFQCMTKSTTNKKKKKSKKKKKKTKMPGRCVVSYEGEGSGKWSRRRDREA